MTTYSDELESFLDSLEYEDLEERTVRRPPVRTPTRRSSFVSRPTPTPASQTQVQAAARNLDSKIETLSNSVKALETRTNGLATEQQRLGTTLRREVAARRSSSDALRAELQQARTMSVIMPMLTQRTINIRVPDDNEGEREVAVLAPSQNQFGAFLPLLLLMPGASGSDGKSGGLFGGDQLGTVLLLSVLSQQK